MKAPIRASLLAAVLALTVAAPVFADPGTTVHESFNPPCRTDEVSGFTFCFSSESDTLTKEKHSGASDVRIAGTISATVVDADGNVVSSYDSTIRERYLVQLGSGGPAESTKITIRLTEETMEAGVTSCTQTHVIVRGDTERVNRVSTTPGPC